jgi:hypothetical protein
MCPVVTRYTTCYANGVRVEPVYCIANGIRVILTTYIITYWSLGSDPGLWVQVRVSGFGSGSLGWGPGL